MGESDREVLPDYWTSPKIVLKCVGPKLVPFFKTVAIYFVLAIPRENPSWFACLIKCLPIVCLCGFVIIHGMSLGEKHTYSRRILGGLIFSSLGDIFLIWPCCFMWGMLSFAIAHLLYIWAFGMHPINTYAGSVSAIVAILGNYVMYPGFYGPYTVLVPIYIFLLMFMVWRAVARVQLFEDLWTWTKLCSCFGGILFALSDTIIGVTMFCMSIPYAQTVVMVTYYAAQLGIALSVVDSAAIAVISAAHTTQNNQSCYTRIQKNKTEPCNKFCHLPLKQNNTVKESPNCSAELNGKECESSHVKND